MRYGVFAYGIVTAAWTEKDTRTGDSGMPHQKGWGLEGGAICEGVSKFQFLHS